MAMWCYDLIYVLEAITNIAFKTAIIVLLYKYIGIRRMKQ